MRGPCSTPSNEWQLGARADEEPDRLRAGRFEVMRGKGRVADPENIRSPAGSSNRGRGLALSTMADAVGASCGALNPMLRLIEAHVLAAERLHGDDTTVPVLR